MSVSIYKYFPLALFSLIWISVVYFLSLELYNVHPISRETWILLFCGVFALFSGYLLFMIYDRSFLRSETDLDDVSFNKPLLAKLIICLFITTVIGSVMMMKVIGDLSGEGLRVYINSPIKVRNEFIAIVTNPLESPPLAFKLGSYMVSASFVSALLGGMLLTVRGKIRFLGFLPLMGAMVTAFATLGRFALINNLGFIFLSFIICSSFYNKQYRVTLLKQFVLFGLLIFSLTGYIFYSVASIRVVQDVDVADYIIRTLYFYFSGGVAALDDFLKTDFQLQYGLSSFRTIFGWLARFGLWGKDEIITGFDSFTTVAPGMHINTYTFVKSLFLDFGILGVLFISFIWGALIKVFLKRSYTQFSLNRVYWACIFIFGSIMSFYSFYFQGITQVVYWGLVVGLIQFVFGKKMVLKSEPAA